MDAMLPHATEWAPVPDDPAVADAIVRRETTSFRDLLAQHERPDGELIPYFDCRVEYRHEQAEARLVFEYPSRVH